MATTTLSAIQIPGRARVASRLAAVTSAWSTRVRQAICALNGGHERYRHLTADRVCLRCLLCGHETAGWTVSPRMRSHDRSIPIAPPARVTSIASHRRSA